MAAPEVEQAYTRARELCQQVGETPQLFPVLGGLWAFYLVRAELQATRELAEQLMSMAQRSQIQPTSWEPIEALGSDLFWLGEVLPGRAHLGAGHCSLRSLSSTVLLLPLWRRPRECCRAYAAWALWLLGYPDQALKRSQEALTLAQELSHPFSLAYALSMLPCSHQFRREGQAAQERAEAVMALATEQGFPFFGHGNDPAGLGAGRAGPPLGRQGQEE